VEMKRTTTRRRGEQGFALIAVLLVGVLLMGIGAAMHESVKSETVLRGTHARSVSGFYTAEAGINRAMGEYRNIFLSYRVPTGNDFNSHTFELRNPNTRVVRMRPSFIFQESAASSQRRIFLGPFFPGRVLRPGAIPVLPDIAGLRFQALHSDDVAEAYRLALHHPVSGPFNLADRQVVTMAKIAVLLGARTVGVPAGLARVATAAGWHSHLVPASPGLLRLFLSLPLLDPGRAEAELGWHPQRTSLDAVACALQGMRNGGDDDTPSLSAATSGPLRINEVLSGIGQRP